MSETSFSCRIVTLSCQRFIRSETSFCLDEVYNGWTLNCSDPEPDCITNDTDYCGICAGGGLDDLGCGCFNPAALEYWYDEDGDDLGYGDPISFCLQDLPENWVLNNNDFESKNIWSEDEIHLNSANHANIFIKKILEQLNNFLETSG